MTPPAPSIVADVKRQLQDEMGLLPLNLLRDRSESFVELYSYDDRGSSSYGTAGYLGDGYFITVKHGVVALNQEGSADPRKITSVKLMYKGQPFTREVVDSGDAQCRSRSGRLGDREGQREDRAAAAEPQPGLRRSISPIRSSASATTTRRASSCRPATLASALANKLVTCLTDGHPGVSGGGVLNRDGELVGIPIGRMQGDYRFSFILPLRTGDVPEGPHLN